MPDTSTLMSSILLALAISTQLCTIATLVIAAFGDWRTFRIPNRYPVLIVVLFTVHAMVAPVSLVSHIFSMALVFIGGLFVFKYKIMAGGDVKLITAVAIWFSLDQVYLLLMFIALAGGLQAVAVVVFHYASTTFQNLVARHEDNGTPLQTTLSYTLIKSGRIPYAVAITAGSLIAFRLIWIS